MDTVYTRQLVIEYSVYSIGRDEVAIWRHFLRESSSRPRPWAAICLQR